MEYLLRLSSKFNLPIEDLILLQDLGTIAGGAVVYALGASEKVNDIDVYTNNKEEILNNLSIKYTNRESDTSINGYEISNEVINIHHTYGIIQLIICDYGPEIINGFDIDYVKCAIHKMKLYISEDCKEAHETKEIKYYSKIAPEYRLDKAAEKGFKLYYYNTCQHLNELYNYYHKTGKRQKLSLKDRTELMESLITKSKVTREAKKYIILLFKINHHWCDKICLNLKVLKRVNNLFYEIEPVELFGFVYNRLFHINTVNNESYNIEKSPIRYNIPTNYIVKVQYHLIDKIHHFQFYEVLHDNYKEAQISNDFYHKKNKYFNFNRDIKSARS